MPRPIRSGVAAGALAAALALGGGIGAAGAQEDGTTTTLALEIAPPAEGSPSTANRVDAGAGGAADGSTAPPLALSALAAGLVGCTVAGLRRARTA